MDYFKDSEMACKCGCGAGIEKMSQRTLLRIDAARELAGIPFIVESAYRCPAHNATVSTETSSHPRGFAIDIRSLTSRERYIIVDALIWVGFNRIGIAKNFIHVDDDPRKPEKCMWVY